MTALANHDGVAFYRKLRWALLLLAVMMPAPLEKQQFEAFGGKGLHVLGAECLKSTFGTVHDRF